MQVSCRALTAVSLRFRNANGFCCRFAFKRPPSLRSHLSDVGRSYPERTRICPATACIPWNDFFVWPSIRVRRDWRIRQSHSTYCTRIRWIDAGSQVTSTTYTASTPRRLSGPTYRRSCPATCRRPFPSTASPSSPANSTSSAARPTPVRPAASPAPGLCTA